MGILRLFLSLSVAIGHIKLFYPNFTSYLPDGQTAVQSFYLISGFYMSFILNTKYDSIKTFYFNRFLRLYPSYWLVLVLVIGVEYLTGIKDFRSLFDISTPAIGTQLYVFLSNIFLLGSDFAYFMKQTFHGLAMTSEYFNSEPFPPLWSLYPIAPSWTLAIEIYFYILAPFFIRNTRILLVIFITSTALRMGFYVLVSHLEPWTYRFFPFEIGVFVLGAFAYKISASRDLRQYSAIVFFVIIACIFIIPNVQLPPMVRKLTFLCLFVSALPFIFQFTKSNRVDRAIGDLSYPIYIVHYPILAIFSGLKISFSYPLLVLGPLFIVSAWIIQKYFQEPIEARFKKSV